MTSIFPGDVVAIRGDKRAKTNGACEYLPEQLVDGKYLKSENGRIWTGRVHSVVGQFAKVGGGWRSLDVLELFCKPPAYDPA